MIMDKKILRDIKSYFCIIFGILTYCFAVTAFLVPSGIISGGFGGIGTVIYMVTERMGFPIPVGVTYFILNFIVLIVAYKIMGWRFVSMSFFGATLASVALVVMQKFITQPLIVDDKFMSCILGGVIGGLGLGLAFNNGGNTGGTDIISLIISRFKNITTGQVGLYCNGFVLLLMFVFFRNVEDIVYGFVTMWVTSYSIDLSINGHRQSFQFMVMSSKYDAIADKVVGELGRGVTILNAEGWYTKNEAKVLLIIASRIDKNKLLHIIKEIDPNAFLSVSRVDGAFGKNFEIIKS